MRRNMYLFNRLTAIVMTAMLLGPMLPLEARTKKGDKFLAEGRLHEQKKEWDAALENYEKALSEDPADILYQMASTKVHFQAGQSHIDKGLKLRSEGTTWGSAARIPEGICNQSRLPRGSPGDPPHHRHDRARAPRVRGDRQGDHPPKSAR